jgi:hypothetical protein
VSADTAVRPNKAAYDENAGRRDRDRAPVKDYEDVEQPV